MAGDADELDTFARDALMRGIDRADIERVLLEAGWTREQATSALAAYADVSFPVPVPRPRASLSARDAFIYLTLFSTLYLTCYHFGKLVFEFVNRAFPDPALDGDGGWRADAMRWSISTLTIAFPVFLLLTRSTERALKAHPIKRFSPVRRWLTYVTLFLAATILIGDLITLVYSVLGGEITTRFILKVATVGAIAGSVFGYYLGDLRRDEKE